MILRRSPQNDRMVAQPSSLSAAWVPASTLPASVPAQQSAPPIVVPGEASQEIDATSLRLAIGDGELELHYQPEVELSTGRIVAMEALLRWRHPQLGVVPPQSFLPLAQRTGLMATVDTWVLAAAAAQARRWAAVPDAPRTIWLNVSSQHLLDPVFTARVTHAINACDLLPGSLGLELSEQVLISLGEHGKPFLKRLRSLGVRLVADDFNSYYSALGPLADLPLDGVKLSHRFVRTAGDHEHDLRFRNVLDQAHQRDMYVVAEGVETLTEHGRLLRLGCDRAHGFLYSRPLGADQAGWLLSQAMVWRPAEAAHVGS